MGKKTGYPRSHSSNSRAACIVRQHKLNTRWLLCSRAPIAGRSRSDSNVTDSSPQAPIRCMGCQAPLCRRYADRSVIPPRSNAWLTEAWSALHISMFHWCRIQKSAPSPFSQVPPRSLTSTGLQLRRIL